MKHLNSNNRLKVLRRSIALSLAHRGAKKITAVITGRQLALAAIVAAVCSVAVAAVLTPPVGVVLSGTGVLPGGTTVFARASFADPTDIKFKIKGQGQEVIQVNNAQETVVQRIEILPGGHTGWHSHPGPVVVLIASGQLSFYDGDDPSCTARTYSAGEAFIDSGQGHVHIARNEGSENLVLWATYFDVPPGGAFRIDAPDPGNCSF